MTQHERLLQMFSDHGCLSNHELREMKPAMYQFPARIKELKAKGHNIVTTRDPNNPKTYYYTMKSKTDLFE